MRRFGYWEPKPESPYNRNLSFRIPASLNSQPVLHIAIRRWNAGSSTNLILFYSTGASRFDRSAEVGLASDVEARTALQSAYGVEQNLLTNFALLLLLGAVCVSLVFSVCKGKGKNTCSWEFSAHA